MISINAIAFIILSIVIAFLAYLFGSKRGAIEIEKELHKQIKLLKFQEDNHKKESLALRQQSERYLNFLVNIPEAVKNINSQLSFDDLITSVIIN